MENTNINSKVDHPFHYNTYPIETIDMMERIFGKEKTRDWCIMTAFKYRMRMGHKDNVVQELEKEAWYLNKAHSLGMMIAEEELNEERKIRAIRDAVANTTDVGALCGRLSDILNGK